MTVRILDSMHREDPIARLKVVHAGTTQDASSVGRKTR